MATLPFQFTSYKDQHGHSGILLFFQVTEEDSLIDFPEALHKLHRYGWIQRQRYSFRMHPLLKELVLKRLGRKYDSALYFQNLMLLINVSPMVNPYEKLHYAPYAQSLLKSFTLPDKENAILANKLSALYIHIHDGESALPLQKKSLRLKKRIHRKTPIPEQLSMSYANLFLIYKSLGESTKAFYSIKQDLKFKSEAKIKNLNYAFSLASLGNIYDDLGKYNDAVTSHEESILIRQGLLEENPFDPVLNLHLAQAYNNIALPLLKLGRTNEAYDYQWKAIEIRQLYLSAPADQNHRSFSESYGNFAEILYAMDKLDEATSYLKKAINIYLTNPVDDPLLSTPLNCLAKIQLKNGKNGQAYKLTKESVRLCKKNLTRKNFMVASAFFHFAKALCANGKLKQAVYYIEEAIKIKSSLNKRHPGLKEYEEFNLILKAFQAKNTTERR